jgi:hypothetical protein
MVDIVSVVGIVAIAFMVGIGLVMLYFTFWADGDSTEEDGDGSVGNDSSLSN